MKQKIAIIVTFIFAVLLTSIIFGYIIFVQKFIMGVTDPRLMVISDSLHGNFVYLYQSGFQDRDVSLCIPISNNPNKIKRITSWRYPEINVIWSKDRSVVAFEMNNYFAAYDFNTGQIIEYNPYRSRIESADDQKNIDTQIKDLINSRGGIGNIVACTYNTYVGMRYKDWKKFIEELKAGEEISLNKSP